MKKIPYLLAIALCTSMLNANFRAPPPKAHFSENKKFKLELTANNENELTVKSTYATLYKIHPDETKTTIWKRNLINDRTPYSIYISNDGQYTLAFNDMHEASNGYLTIYGKEGQLHEIITSQKYYSDPFFDIRGNPICFFGEDNLHFYILNMDGFLTLIHLPSGFVYTKSTEILLNYDEVLEPIIWHQHYAYERAKVICTEYLESKDSLWANRRGIEIAAMLHYKEAIPKIRTFLESTEFHTYEQDGQETKQYYLRKAAKKGLEAMGVEVSDAIIIHEPL